MALLGLVAIAGTVFATQPTIEVNPTSMTVLPNVPFVITISFTYTNELRIFKGSPTGVCYEVSLPDDVRNSPETHHIDFRTQINTSEFFWVYVYGSDEGEVEYRITFCKVEQRPAA